MESPHQQEMWLQLAVFRDFPLESPDVSEQTDQLFSEFLERTTPRTDFSLSNPHDNINQYHTRAPPPPPKENAARHQAANKELVDLRDANWPYKDIAQVLERKHGVVATPNALAKRYRKLKSQEEYLAPLPEAIKNVMPDIMALIRNEAVRVGLSAADMKWLEDLPEMIPNMVQDRILRNKKA